MSIRTPRILAPASAAIDVLEYEVMHEKAATLGRLTRAFERAFAAFRACEEETAATAALERDPERRQLLDAAAEAVWHLVVQREASGLPNTEAVLREYGVPAALRLRMGAPRRR